MKNWRDTVAKQLGPNAVKYVYKQATMENNVMTFHDQTLFTTALRDRQTLEMLFPGVVIKCTVGL